MVKQSGHNEIYLDNAATTKPCAEAVEATARALAEEFGNASSAHTRGKQAKALLDESRAVVADALGVDPSEIYFTSGATEANNLAIRGAATAQGTDAGAIVTSELEHPSVTRSVRGLRRDGYTTVHVPAVGGTFDMDALERSLKQPTQLVTVMQVQNEMGYVFPIADIAACVREYAPQALFHCDATQAFCKLDVLPYAMDVDLLSVASHKICGPKGVGALFVKQGTKMFTTAFGGGQERGLRSGTEPVFLIAGFAAAIKTMMAAKETNYKHVRALRDHLYASLQSHFSNVVFNSREDGSPYIVSFALPGNDNRVLVQGLSDAGIYVSSASACTHNRHTVPEGTWREKHPLSMQAAGIPEEINSATLRVSFCPASTIEEVDAFVSTLATLV